MVTNQPLYNITNRNAISDKAHKANPRRNAKYSVSLI